MRSAATQRCLETGLLAVALWLAPAPSVATDVYEFAECITDSGVVFCGAEWCSQCAKQREAFGDADYLLPYFECVSDYSDGMVDECDGIESFPTWSFPDGSVETGRKSFARLAARTGCPLPDPHD